MVAISWSPEVGVAPDDRPSSAASQSHKLRRRRSSTVSPSFLTVGTVDDDALAQSLSESQQSAVLEAPVVRRAWGARDFADVVHEVARLPVHNVMNSLGQEPSPSVASLSTEDNHNHTTRNDGWAVLRARTMKRASREGPSPLAEARAALAAANNTTRRIDADLVRELLGAGDSEGSHTRLSQQPIRSLSRASSAPCHGGRPDNRRPPRCASGFPKHLVKREMDAQQLRRTLWDEEMDRAGRHGGDGSVDGLRAMLRHKHQNAARGWCREVAKDGMGVEPVSFGHFCSSLQRLGFEGNASRLWTALAARTGGVKAGLEDFEPKVASGLDMLASALMRRCLDSTGLWRQVPRANLGRVTIMELTDFLVSTSLVPPAKQHLAQLALNALDSSQKGALRERDLVFLDRWALRRSAKLRSQ